MKTRTPFDRNDLKIGKSDKALEVESGNNPMYRSNVLCEKFISNNYHRSGDIKIYSHQTLVSELPNERFSFYFCRRWFQ